MITTERTKELEAQKAAEIAQINAQIAEITAKYDAEIKKTEQLGKAHEEFTKLVAKFNYGTAKEFLLALGLISPDKKVSGTKGNKAQGQGGGKRKRLSEEENAKLIDDLKSEKFTNKELAEKYGVSSQTVQLKKDKAGLVKSRG